MKKNILLLFGGRSTEHEVSIRSAATMDGGLDRNKYNVYKVFISKDGLWRYFEGDIAELRDKANEEKLIREGAEAAIMPGSEVPTLLVNAGGEGKEGWTKYPLDIAIPALHGKNGEDGTIQGLFELARLPYVGCGVLASAVGMDKITTKRIVAETTNIRQADYAAVFAWELKDNMNEAVSRVEDRLSYPVYVKPANAGSSVGVSKAHDREELKKAFLLAAENDSRILVEENINGHEVECAVLGSTAECKASRVGEIMAADTFYTYDAKYNNPESETIVDADLPEETIQEIRKDACQIFKAINGSGLSRVDFFVDKVTGEVIFNEINTMPGFTSISMYPMLWQRQGLSVSDLMDQLIEIGFNR